MARAKKPASVGDMVRSLLVILVPLLIITVLFTRLPQGDQVKVVDWTPVLATARAAAPYPVLAPAALPSGWRATRVSWVAQGKSALNGQPSPRNAWQLGVLNADNIYLEINQGDAEIDDMIAQDTRAGLSDGQSTVGEQVWQRLLSPDGRTRSLVWSQPEVTTVVSGDLSYEALDSYAATLTS